MQNIANYFDYAAATPMLSEAVAAMEPFFTDNFYNPSALYLAAKDNKHKLDNFRHEFAQGMGARPTEIVFTAGGTEANNLAISGILGLNTNGHIVTTAIEHDSVLLPIQDYDNTIVDVDERGIVNPTHILSAITDKTVLVSVMYANNEVGSIQPIKNITENIALIRNERLKRGIKTPIYVHTDACQASNFLDMQISYLGVDLMTINSGKIYGPKQCGALYVKVGIVLKPLIKGGGQEWGMRSGTENLANISGFNTAWALARRGYRNEATRLSGLRDAFISDIKNAIPKIQLNGPTGNRRLANNIHITIPGFDNERLLMELDERGFQVATGSACSASNDEPSHVLKALGITDDNARNSIRISLGKHTNQQALDDLKANIISITK
jgi:cysteine desulfurase